MRRYKDRVPDVNKVTEALIKQGIIKSQADISNDHVAFRTMGVPQLGIQSFEKIFLKQGYLPKDEFFFEGKRLNARWYAPPSPEYPRIFISELRVEDMPEEIQAIIKSYTDEVKTDPVDSLNLDSGEEVDLFLHQPLWRVPTWDDFKKLQAVSEYAAWVIYNR